MKKPSIVVNRDDHARLSRMADGFYDTNPELAEELLGELARARVVTRGESLRDSAQMGATLTYRADDGSSRRVTLVWPGEADIEQGRISVLTPIGVALLGLSPGQSIEWTAKDGRARVLTVETVEYPTVEAV